MNALFSDSEDFQAAVLPRRGKDQKDECDKQAHTDCQVCLGQTNRNLILVSEDQPKGMLLILDTVSWKFRMKLKWVLDPQK